MRPAACLGAPYGIPGGAEAALPSAGRLVLEAAEQLDPTQPASVSCRIRHNGVATPEETEPGGEVALSDAGQRSVVTTTEPGSHPLGSLGVTRWLQKAGTRAHFPAPPRDQPHAESHGSDDDVGLEAPMALGVEVAGTLIGVGSEVTGMKVGDAVLGHPLQS
jgi:Alcohol dehydrogenase GroES-like domain